MRYVDANAPYSLKYYCSKNHGCGVIVTNKHNTYVVMEEYCGGNIEQNWQIAEKSIRDNQKIFHIPNERIKRFPYLKKNTQDSFF